MTEPVLAISQLHIRLPKDGGQVPIVRGLDLDVSRGEVVGIAGESGSGKSLTAQALLNIVPPGAQVSGSVTFNGRDLLALSERQWQEVRGNDIAMVFQDSASALHPMLPVGKQLTEHMLAHLRISRAEATRRAIELLEQVRLPHPDRALKAYPHQFSGGMRQRIAIASALACDPQVLIADEPTTALDVTVQAGILRLFRQLCAERDLAVIFITHDLGVLASLADRTYVLYSGLVMEHGPTSRILTRPRHPYTRALLEARPHGLEEQRDLVPIPGSPAPAGTLLHGCPFAPRCAFSVDRCVPALPPLAATGSDSAAACVVLPDFDEEG